jgi:hypothetical protein
LLHLEVAFLEKESRNNLKLNSNSKSLEEVWASKITEKSSEITKLESDLKSTLQALDCGQAIIEKTSKKIREDMFALQNKY